MNTYLFITRELIQLTIGNEVYYYGGFYEDVVAIDVDNGSLNIVMSGQRMGRFDYMVDNAIKYIQYYFIISMVL